MEWEATTEMRSVVADAIRKDRDLSGIPYPAEALADSALQAVHDQLGWIDLTPGELRSLVQALKTVPENVGVFRDNKLTFLEHDVDFLSMLGKLGDAVGSDAMQAWLDKEDSK